MTKKEMLHDALCNGISEFGYSGLELVTKKEDNEKLKEMFPKFFEEHNCYEDRLMLLVENGFNLYIKDVENEGEYDEVINLEKLEKRHTELIETPLFLRTIADIANEDGDSTTAFDYLQFIAYGESIFG